ncbi:MAG TPA: class D sortase [Pseudoneobacillus sp.]|nr:class D sortase [Pseudoneobacillus sp.]
MNQKNILKKSTLITISICLVIFGTYLISKNTLLLVKGNKIVEASEKKDIEATTVSTLQSNKPLYPNKPIIGEKIGELIIPKLNANLPIIHGTNEDELESGVGHFTGSVLPGEEDNSVLAGHRDTVFRKLGEVGVNDRIIVKTSAGTFTYKIKKVRIVDKDDRTVIVPMPRATLTVSTCYPFTFIGPAPQRYVLVADLISSK